MEFIEKLSIKGLRNNREKGKLSCRESTIQGEKEKEREKEGKKEKKDRGEKNKRESVRRTRETDMHKEGKERNTEEQGAPEHPHSTRRCA